MAPNESNSTKMAKSVKGIKKTAKKEQIADVMGKTFTAISKPKKEIIFKGITKHSIVDCVVVITAKEKLMATKKEKESKGIFLQRFTANTTDDLQSNEMFTARQSKFH